MVKKTRQTKKMLIKKRWRKEGGKYEKRRAIMVDRVKDQDREREVQAK